MVKFMARWCLVVPGSWILAVRKSLAKSALPLGRRILARIFLREPDPVGSLPVGNSVRSIAYLKHLGRLRRREAAIASDLGSLAQALERQGLHEHARHLARNAFDHWCLARKAEARLLRKADEVLGGKTV